MDIMENKKLIHINVLSDIKIELEQEAKEKGKTLTAHINDIFEKHLKRKKVK